MSHVVVIDDKIMDLNAMIRCALSIGMEVMVGQKTYKWWGHSVGDYKIPEGFTEADLGKCEHAIKVIGKKNAYEIGIVKAKDGEGYSLMWDFYAGGQGLEKVAGKDCCNLIQAYNKEITMETMSSFSCQEIPLENGDIMLEFTR